MTSANGHPVPVPASQLLAERFGADIVPFDLTGQAPGEGGRRTRFIATVHALLAWLAAHPNVPVPWSIAITIDVQHVADLERLAGQLNIKPFPPEGDPRQVTVFRPLASDEFYTPISITVAGDKERPL